MPRSRHRLRVIVALGAAALALTLGACGSSSGDGRADATTALGAAPTGTLTVSAASSLTEAFTAIGKQFEAANPGTEVRFNFAASGAIVSQIEGGAPVDVIALADTVPMEELDKQSLLTGPGAPFARNRMIIITKPGNPDKITRLADLKKVGVVAMCVASAPCGRYGDQVLSGSDVLLDPKRVTRAQDAKATLAAVADGDADAGLVYVTDAQAAGDKVGTVTIPDDKNVYGEYPIAQVKASTRQDLGYRFVVFVRSSEGQAEMGKAGFLRP